MTQDLWMLAWAAALTMLQLVPILLARLKTPGAAEWGLGNRSKPFDGPLPDWGQRAIRAHANMLENLPHFTALVLVAHVGGKANAMTLLGAQVFLASRVVYAGIYIGGVKTLRTLVYMVGMAAEFLIFAQLFR